MKGMVLLIMGFCLSGCMVGPDYKRPDTTVPARFKEAQGKAFKPEAGWTFATPFDLKPRGQWWKVFHDPELDALEDQLNTYNQSIVQAMGTYLQSLAIVDEARASYYPTLVGAFNLFRQKTGGGTTTFFNNSNGSSTASTASGSSFGSGPTITTYSSFLAANWEPDIWGAVRRTVEGDKAQAQANEALLAATRLSAQGSLAQYYFELLSLDRDQQLLDKTVKGYKETLQLTKNKYAAGVSSRSDIVQAQSQLESAEAQAINNGILRGQYEHAIAVLIGRPPADFSLRFKPLNTKPPVIPVSVPCVWLERRPDIAQAERLMQQANAQIGIAVAAYYPSLNLTATVSAAGRSFAQLINRPVRGWSAGMQLAEIIIDGGLRAATLRAQKAAYIAQVASYRQTVLTAFQNVEDSLIALRLLEKQGQALDAAARDARLALKLIINQYKSGTVDYSSVITAQIAAYQAEKTAYDVVGLQMTGAVMLIKALGGGWSTADIMPA